MPTWLVEWFGRGEFRQLFSLLVAMTAPFWLAMLFWPRHRMVRRVMQPWLVPGLLSLVWGYIIYLMIDVGSVPRVREASYDEARTALRNPFVMLLLFCHIQIFNLAAGAAVYQDSRRRGLRVRLDLLAIWLLGPPGLLLYALRIALKKPRKPENPDTAT